MKNTRGKLLKKFKKLESIYANTPELCILSRAILEKKATKLDKKIKQGGK